jgi:hypothetical protein
MRLLGPVRIATRCNIILVVRIMMRKNKCVIVMLCEFWIVLFLCLQVFMLLSSRIVGTEFYVRLLDLFFLVILGIGLWAGIHNKSWSLRIFIVGITGILILSIASDCPQIMDGNIFAIIKIPLILILTYFFISYLREDIKDEGKIT